MYVFRVPSHSGNQGKLREFGEKHKNQGKLREFVSVTQNLAEGKGVRQFGVRLVPCFQVVFID